MYYVLVTARYELMIFIYNFQTAYEQAKKDFAKEEWADKLSGIEKIVTIARKAPEVLKVDLKEVVKLMLVELQNLRSQVCRAAALVINNDNSLIIMVFLLLFMITGLG